MVIKMSYEQKNEIVVFLGCKLNKNIESCFFLVPHASGGLPPLFRLNWSDQGVIGPITPLFVRKSTSSRGGNLNGALFWILIDQTIVYIVGNLFEYVEGIFMFPTKDFDAFGPRHSALQGRHALVLWHGCQKQGVIGGNRTHKMLQFGGPITQGNIPLHFQW